VGFIIRAKEILVVGHSWKRKSLHENANTKTRGCFFCSAEQNVPFGLSLDKSLSVSKSVHQASAHTKHH